MKLLICIVATGALFVASAQDKKNSTGVLHPELTVAKDAGTHAAPMGKIGDKGEVWSGTTMAAGVDGKPQPGKTVTVVGEIVDMSCYLQLGKHGEKHVACGKKCILAGQPIGLVTKTGDVMLVMDEEHDPRRDGQTSAFRKAAADHIGHIMEVTGTEASHKGVKAVFVQGYVNK